MLNVPVIIKVLSETHTMRVNTLSWGFLRYPNQLSTMLKNSPRHILKLREFTCQQVTKSSYVLKH